MRPGDAIYLHSIDINGVRAMDEWLPCIVMAVEGSKFLVRRLKNEAFDKDGVYHLKWMSMYCEGRQWRRTR